MKKKIFVFCLAILIVLMVWADFKPVKSENETAIQKAVEYLKAGEQTAWSVMALAAAGEEDIKNYLNQISFSGTSPSDYAKYILALTGTGENPSQFNGKDFIKELRNCYDKETNQFGAAEYISDDIWTILALGSVGKEYLPEVQQAKDFILSNQNGDGGWSFGLKGNSSSADMTASAIMALLEAGVGSDELTISKAKNYLRAIQNSDGGFPGWTGESSASSDAWVISTISKLGENPNDWSKNGKTPIDHLKSLQNSEKGFFYDTEGGAGEDSFVVARTSYAVIALSGKSYPISSSFNSHPLRIEGLNNTICEEEINGGTALDLVIEAAKLCAFDYSLQYYQEYDSLFLSRLNNEENWEYRVNNVLPMVGGDNYYLNPEDEVLWFGVGNLWGTWLATKVELTKIDNLVKVQTKYYNSTSSDWQDLKVEGIKVKVGDAEFFSNSEGQIEISLATLGEGFYQIFIESQIINGTGYTRSEKVSLRIGESPQSHRVGLKVEIERIEAPQEGKQETISFSLSPDVLDFGKLKPGESAARNLTINNGATEIYLEAEVKGDYVFQENLKIDELFWQDFSTVVESNKEKTMPVGLTIPPAYSGDFGQQEGELTFWAIKK